MTRRGVTRIKVSKPTKAPYFLSKTTIGNIKKKVPKLTQGLIKSIESLARERDAKSRITTKDNILIRYSNGNIVIKKVNK